MLVQHELAELLPTLLNDVVGNAIWHLLFFICTLCIGRRKILRATLIRYWFVIPTLTIYATPFIYMCGWIRGTILLSFAFTLLALCMVTDRYRRL